MYKKKILLITIVSIICFISYQKNYLKKIFYVDKENTITSFFEFGPNSNKENNTYFYDGDYVKIPYKFLGRPESNEVGLLLFLDGIPQNFEIENQEKSNNYIHIFNLEKNQEKKIIIKFNPIKGKKGDKLSLDFVCVDNPSYKLSEKDIGTFKDHRIMQGENLWLKMNKDSELNLKFKAVETYKSRNFSDQEKIFFKEKDGSSSLDNFSFFDLYQNENENQIISENGKIKFSFKVFGAESKNCKTTFFLNHQPIKIADYNYLGYDIEKGKEVLYNLDLEINNLKKYNTFYSITVYYRNDELKNESIITKTVSMIVINKH